MAMATGVPVSTAPRASALNDGHDGPDEPEDEGEVVVCVAACGVPRRWRARPPGARASDELVGRDLVALHGRLVGGRLGDLRRSRASGSSSGRRGRTTDAEARDGGVAPGFLRAAGQHAGRARLGDVVGDVALDVAAGAHRSELPRGRPPRGGPGPGW